MATTLQMGGRVPPVDDRRSSDRRKIEQLVYVSFGPNNGGFLLDVSEGGLSCRVVGALIQGETCRPKFILPETASVIEVDCLIAWTNESKKVGGLKFVDLPEDVRGSIREWLSQEPLDGSIRHVVMATKMGPIEFGPISPAALEAPRLNEQANAKAAIVKPAAAFETTPSEAQATKALALVNIPASPDAVTLVGEEAATKPEEDINLRARDVLSQPPPTALRLSTGSAIAISAVLVAALVFAYQFGRTIGFQNEAVRLGAVPTASAPTEPVVAASPEPALPDRVLDSSLSNAQLATPSSVAAGSTSVRDSSTAAAGDRAVLPAPHRSATEGRTASLTQAASKSSKARAGAVRSTLPLRPGRRAHTDPATSPASSAAPPDLAIVAPPALDSRPLSINTFGNSPVQPQPRAAAFPAAVQAPVLIQRVEPLYSPVAKELGVEGTVQVSAIIGKDGTPRALAVVKGDPRLAESALDAVRKWRYQPALSGAYTVEAPITITIDFRIRK